MRKTTNRRVPHANIAGMAKETVVRLIDDLDGSVLEAEGTTVEFGIEGQTYEIDLSPDNLDRFRKALEPFVSAGRPVRGKASVPRGRRSRAATRNDRQTAVRDWARENGYAVGERGRLPGEVLAAYEAAN